MNHLTPQSTIWHEVGFTGQFETVLPVICSYLTLSDKVRIHRNLQTYLPQFRPSSFSFAPESNMWIDRRVREIVPQLEPMLPLIFTFLSPNEMEPLCAASLRILHQNYREGAIERQMLRIRKFVSENNASNKMVCSVFRIENALAQSHTFFYHSTCLEVYLLTVLTRAFFSTGMANESQVYLRFPKANSPKNVTEHFTSHPFNRSALYSYDRPPKLREALISVNPNLFSNVHQTDAGESTWDFYIRNRSVYPPYLNNFLEELFFTYELRADNEILPSFNAIYSQLLSCAHSYLKLLTQKEWPEQGVLLQFAIPNSEVAQVCYHSHAYGVPRNRFSDQTFHDLIATISEHSYQSEDGEICDRMEAQGRIVTGALFTSDHNIQIFAHGYGRFFDERVFSFANMPTHPLPWKFAENLERARKTDLIEEGLECVTLRKQRDALLEQAKSLFAKVILASPSDTTTGQFLSQFYTL